MLHEGFPSFEATWLCVCACVLCSHKRVLLCFVLFCAHCIATVHPKRQQQWHFPCSIHAYLNMYLFHLSVADSFVPFIKQSYHLTMRSLLNHWKFCAMCECACDNSLYTCSLAIAMRRWMNSVFCIEFESKAIHTQLQAMNFFQFIRQLLLPLCSFIFLFLFQIANRTKRNGKLLKILCDSLTWMTCIIRRNACVHCRFTCYKKKR